jgi:hypothetical protein
MSTRIEHRQLILDTDHGTDCLGWYMRHDERDGETGDLATIAVDTPCDGDATQTRESALAEAMEFWGCGEDEIEVCD